MRAGGGGMGNAESSESGGGGGEGGEAPASQQPLGLGVVNVLMKLGCVSSQDAADEDENCGPGGNGSGGGGGCVVAESPLDPPHPLDGVAATYGEAHDVHFHHEHQMSQMNKSEEIFLKEFRVMMETGFKLIEHVAGDASTKTLRLTRDTVVVWSDDLSSASASAPLADLSRVLRGGGGRVTEDIDDRCLVLEAGATCLVLETVDTETRELIADGFELLLTSGSQCP